MNDKEGDEDVLYSEEKVLAICREGKVIAVRICQRYGISEGFENIG